MPSIDELEYEVTTLLKKYMGRKERPEANQRLFHDLGLYGDDAWEFLDELSKRYGIAEPQFDGSEHFPNEGEVWPWPFSIFGGRSNKWKPVTVVELVKYLEKAISENNEEVDK